MKENRSKISIVAAVIGTGLEYYDFMLYTHFLFIISPLFFPSDDIYVSRLLGMMSFALGFLMRPIGGIIFGHLADKIGRKKTLIISIMLITIPTFTIGILPSYAKLGILSAVILMLCRLIQSFSVGGESSSSTIFVAEHANPRFSGTMNSLLISAADIGGIIGTSFGIIVTLSFMPEWGWRIPFLMGVILGLIGFYVRNKFIYETKDFLKVKKQNKTISIPLLEALKSYKKQMLCIGIMSAGVVSPFYIIFVYMVDILKNNFHLKTNHILMISTALMALEAIILPLAGLIADKFGKSYVMKLSAIGISIVSLPLFILLENFNHYYVIILSQVVLTIVASGLVAPCGAFIAKLTPVNIRTSVVGFSWSIGVIIFGGMGPALCFTLATLLNNVKAPAIWLIICGILSWIGVTLSHRVLKSHEFMTKKQCTNFT